MWRFWPEVKVMMDPRQFPYPWYPEYRDLEMGKNIDGFLNKYDCDIFLVENRQNIIMPWLMNSPDWNLVYLGKIATIFKKKYVNLSLDAYGIQTEKLNFNYFYEAIYMLNVSLNYYDIETAKVILEKLESQWLSPNQKNILLSIKFQIEGIIAYYNKDYKKAVDSFEKSGHGYIDNKKVHANSLYYLAQKKWENDDIKGAYEYLLEIVKMLKGPHNLYNLGVVKWYAMEKNIELPYSDEINDMSWKELLERYIKSFGVFQYQEKIIVAQGIIDGNYKEKPQILIPFEVNVCLRP
jgi:hypothetical protein